MTQTKQQRLEQQLIDAKMALDELPVEPAPPNEGVTLPGAPTKAANKGKASSAGAISPKRAAKKAIAQNRKPAASQDKGAVKPKAAAKKALAQVGRKPR